MKRKVQPGADHDFYKIAVFPDVLIVLSIEISSENQQILEAPK